MADGLSVYGALTASIDLLVKIYSTIRNYIDLPEALATIKSRLLSCLHALGQWRRNFRIQDVAKPERFFQALWGTKGYKEVFTILERLKFTISRIWKYVKDEHSTVRRTWKRFIGACVDRASKLNVDIASFNLDMNGLQQTSYGWINKLYGVDLERGGNFNEVLHRGIFHRRTRQRAESLHDAFLAKRTVTYLALEPLKMSRHQRSGVVNWRSPQNRARSKVRDVAKDKDFQFLLQVGTAWVPIWLRPSIYKGNPTFCYSFSKMGAQVAVAGSCNLKTPEPSRELTFRVRKYDEASLSSFSNTLPLSQHLRSMWPRERAQVAYAIASGFYRVVGSPWGDYFERENIRVKPITTNKWAVALQAQQGDARLVQILDKSRLIHHMPGKKMVYHCQVYRLGVVLTELALGRPAMQLWIENANIPLPAGNRLDGKDAFSTAIEVERVMGSKYMNAVFFCLSIFTKTDEIKKDNLDFEFEQEVLIPLQNLHEASQVSVE